MQPDRQAQFMLLITEAQPRLFAFILSLLPDRHTARDVLQETNLTLWEKADEFEHGTNFGAWSARIARYKVLSHMRDRGRDRHLFDEATLDRIAAITESVTELTRDRMDALAACLHKLPAQQRELIHRRYDRNESPAEIADATHSSANTVRQSLFRIRHALLKCVQRTLGGEGAP
jgi:RNA polymerase sigma-70 factor (ECF subfamily)